MKLNYELTADVADYAAKYGIPFDAAIGVLTLIGWDALKAILVRP